MGWSWFMVVFGPFFIEIFDITVNFGLQVDDVLQIIVGVVALFLFWIRKVANSLNRGVTGRTHVKVSRILTVHEQVSFDFPLINIEIFVFPFFLLNSHHLILTIFVSIVLSLEFWHFSHEFFYFLSVKIQLLGVLLVILVDFKLISILHLFYLTFVVLF